MNARLRLLHLRECTESTAEEMADQRGRFQALADPASAPRAVSAFNLFQTPETLAQKMAAWLPLEPDSRILEPSAGLGRLYRAVRDLHAGPITLIEYAPQCCRELYDMTSEDRQATLKQGDFLAQTPDGLGTFDGIIMNPPFKMGRDIRHILHAVDFLAVGGVLVSLCYDGPRQQAQLKPIADYWEDLPADTFKSEGTRADVALLVITK
jgi:phospholipid N-methyltransferase